MSSHSGVHGRLVLLCAVAGAMACGKDRRGDAARSADVATSATSAGNVVMPGVVPATENVNGIPHWRFDAAAFERAPRWTVESTPAVAIGGAGDTTAFDLTYTQDVQLLDDGRLVVLTGTRSALLVFGADGSPQHRYGRVDSGPPELVAPAALIWTAGDTLLVPDLGAQRLHRAHPSSGIVRSSTLDRGSMFGGIRLNHNVGVVRSRLVGVGRRTGPGWSNVDTAGREIRLVGSSNFDGSDAGQIALTFGPRPAELRIPSGTRSVVDVRPPRLSQQPIVAVWDSAIVIGSDSGFAFQLRSVWGVPIAALHVARTRRVVTPEMRAAVVAADLERLLRRPGERGGDSSVRRQIIAQRAFADSLPYFGRMFVTRGGTLWITDYTAPGSGTGWAATAFGRGGRLVGRVVAEGDGTPVQFTDDRVVVRTDTGGTVRLFVSRLYRP